MDRGREVVSIMSICFEDTAWRCKNGKIYALKLYAMSSLAEEIKSSSICIVSREMIVMHMSRVACNCENIAALCKLNDDDIEKKH